MECVSVQIFESVLDEMSDFGSSSMLERVLHEMLECVLDFLSL